MKEIRIEKKRILEAMSNYPPGTPEYEELLKELSILNDVSNKSFTFDNPTVISGAWSFGTVVTILAFEWSHILRSKSFSFVQKIKG